MDRWGSGLAARSQNCSVPQLTLAVDYVYQDVAGTHGGPPHTHSYKVTVLLWPCGGAPHTPSEPNRYWDVCMNYIVHNACIIVLMAEISGVILRLRVFNHLSRLEIFLCALCIVYL